MAKLIAFIDGSTYAASVCENAAWIASRTGAEVELLHVLGRRETKSAPGDLSGNITLGARTSLLAELADLDAQRAKLAQKRGRAILDDAREVVLAAGVERVGTRLRFGDIVETVTEMESDAEMIVIGKRGEAADFATLHLGSNLERVVRASQRPVYVAARAFRPVTRFLIAFDGGASSLKAVDHVSRNRLFAGLECHLLTVGADGRETRRKLEDAEAMLKAGGFEVEARAVPGQPDRIISETVEAQGIDLLVMGAYGHTRIRNLIIGSTTTEMIRSCKVPVILFR